jgi:sugar phosphate isomerase/epimerase
VERFAARAGVARIPRPDFFLTEVIPVGEIRLSCYSGPWGADGAIPAIEAMGEIGLEGIETPASLVGRYEDRQHVFEEILESKHLRLSGLLQGLNLVNAETADEQVERAANAARFLHHSDGRGRLTICQSELGARAITEEDWSVAMAIVEEIGVRCREFGVDLCFMPRAGFLGGTEKELKRILATITPENLFLALDTGETTLAGIEPHKWIKTHAERIKSVRFRDVSGAKRRSMTTSSRPGTAPAFGRGALKFDAVSKALSDIGYSGWVVVDVSGEGGDPKEAAEAAFRYVMRKSGLFGY